jgi:hypothetical protein
MIQRIRKNWFTINKQSIFLYSLFLFIKLPPLQFQEQIVFFL